MNSVQCTGEYLKMFHRYKSQVQGILDSSYTEEKLKLNSIAIVYGVSEDTGIPSSVCIFSQWGSYFFLLVTLVIPTAARFIMGREKSYREPSSDPEITGLNMCVDIMSQVKYSSVHDT